MITEPIFFKRNRVRRIYTGGKLFGNFFGDEPTDEASQAQAQEGASDADGQTPEKVDTE